MVLIADSGSTKTHWRLVDRGKVVSAFTTQGLNPYYCTSETYATVLESGLPKDYQANELKTVFFYSAGCAGKEMADIARSSLAKFFKNAEVNVYSDMLAAARALFGKGKGLFIILGSGASVGYYNGESIEQKSPSLGFVLGDEGSGAYLGKKLIKAWLYGELPNDLSFQIKVECPFEVSQILKRIYSEPFPNRFLASFVPFLEKNSGHPFVNQMVDDAFEDLIRHHLLRYSDFFRLPIGVVGSVGSIFGKNLSKLIEAKGGKISRILHYPIDEMVRFHIENT